MSRRSVMITPGDRPAMMRNAPDSGADVVVFDLEDAVLPEQKAAARTAVRDVLADPSFDPDCEVCLRVNPLAQVGADLEAVFADEQLRLDAVMAPKVESANDVETLASRLADHGWVGPIFALLETPGGVLAADVIGQVDAVDALVFGAEDLAAAIGATRTDEGTEVLYARERVVLAAAAGGCSAIDTLVTDLSDMEHLREDTAFAIQLGFDGKLAIHPDQVGPINEAFAPTADDIAWAETVLEKKRAADADGRGVFSVDGEMIDPPLIRQAERILERSAAARDDR